MDETDAYNKHLTETNIASQRTKIFEQKLKEMCKEQEESMKNIGANEFEDNEYN